MAPFPRLRIRTPCFSVALLCGLAPELSFSCRPAGADAEEEEQEEKSPMYIDKERLRVLQETRCDSKARGSVYDPVLGICCHFCR